MSAAARAKGWYFVKIDNHPAPIWQPGNWNGTAFWIGDRAYREDKMVSGGFMVIAVDETRLPDPDERGR